MRKKRIERICPVCNNTFETIPSRIKIGKGIYCSNECSRLASRNRIERTCQQCGKAFDVCASDLVHSKALFCSTTCYDDSRRNQIVLTCQCCHQEFFVDPSYITHNSAKYCSRQCYNTAMKGSGNHNWKGGRIGARGVNWSSQRKLAWQRDGGVCQICHKTPSNRRLRCDVHHIIPYRNFNGDFIAANDLSNLITLCRSCHVKAEHGKLAVPRRLF